MFPNLTPMLILAEWFVPAIDLADGGQDLEPFWVQATIPGADPLLDAKLRSP
jgi:hypothetical protein